MNGGSAIDIRPVVHDVTLVIPTLGRAILHDSLTAIAAGDAWPGRLIVVDQGSASDVRRWMDGLRSKGMDARHCPSSQKGRAAAVNRGLEQVETRFAAITDDDCLVEPDWLSSLVRRLREAPDTIVTGRVEAEGDEPAVALMTAREPALYRRPLLQRDVLCGGNMGLSREVLDRIGLLDEDPRLRAAEDCEWSYRALRAGVPIAYAPEVVVHHCGWRDEAQRADQYRSYARSHGGFYGKYLRQGDLFIALRVVIHLLRALKRWVAGAVTGNRDKALNGRAYLTGLLPGIWAAMRRNARP
ncbi:MAG: glycosyltransferase [Gammaproteobacteria bacterium]|jgi:GT2 family glycosyltransferase